MATAKAQGVDPQQLLKNQNLGRDSLVGGLLGLFVGQPVLGALGGAAFNLFKTPGMADGMKSVAQDLFSGLGAGGGVKEAVDALGKGLFDSAGTKTRADPSAAEAGAKAAEKKSGIPGWAKWLGLGGGALMLANGLFDNFSMGGFGNPLFGGFGMNPFMDPMSMMMGDPMSMMMGGGMGMMPANNLMGGMGLIDLLIAGGVGYAGYKMLSR